MAVVALAVAASSAWPANAQAPAPPAYVPHRVFDARAGRFADFEAMLADLMYADVLFLGEQHDSGPTHRLQAAVLEGLARRRGNVLLSLEMFERDTQGALDDYLAGRIGETEFLGASRPWPRYATDYRPLVEFARLWRWPVVASNVPRRVASLVARRGLPGIDSLTTADRPFAASAFHCPRDEYFDRFARTMGDMASHGPAGQTQTAEEKQAALERTYQAQCVKDETMGESIARAFSTAPPRPLVVHVNGAFHSDFRLGAAERARRHLRGRRVAVVSFVPVDNLDTADGGANRKLGDYVVFVLKPSP